MRKSNCRICKRCWKYIICKDRRVISLR